LRAKGCRQIGVPVPAVEGTVLRILDQEIFAPAALARLEAALRREFAARASRPNTSSLPTLEKRERTLAQRVAEGARRVLEVDAEIVADVKTALAEMRQELEGVRRAIEAEKRSTHVGVDVEATVAQVLGTFRSMAETLHTPSVPLEKRREVLRRLLPTRDGDRPIKFYFDSTAELGWRKALKRAAVRHISLRTDNMFKTVVAGAVAAEGEHPEAPGWELAEGLPTWERELVTAHFEEVGELVGAGVDG